MLPGGHVPTHQTKSISWASGRAPRPQHDTLRCYHQCSLTVLCFVVSSPTSKREHYSFVQTFATVLHYLLIKTGKTECHKHWSSEWSKATGRQVSTADVASNYVNTRFIHHLILLRCEQNVLTTHSVAKLRGFCGVNPQLFSRPSSESFVTLWEKFRITPSLGENFAYCSWRTELQRPSFSPARYRDFIVQLQTFDIAPNLCARRGYGVPLSRPYSTPNFRPFASPVYSPLSTNWPRH